MEARYSIKCDTIWTGYKVHLTETYDVDAPHLIICIVSRLPTTEAALQWWEAYTSPRYSRVALNEQHHQSLKGAHRKLKIILQLNISKRQEAKDNMVLTLLKNFIRPGGSKLFLPPCFSIYYFDLFVVVLVPACHRRCTEPLKLDTL